MEICAPLDKNYTYTLPDYLDILEDNTRYIFGSIFVVISVASLICNTAAIIEIYKRKTRIIQKTCIVSLALADMASTLVIAVNNLETFSHRLIVWTLGGFLCSFIPMCQMAAIVASSTALTFIAMDRYRNVVHALSKRWNPRLSFCLICSLILWLLSFVSIPLYQYFDHQYTRLITNSTSIDLCYKEVYVCVSFYKDEMKDYYIAMVVIIFLPLLLVFIWFYYNIAALIWKHRKPVSAGFNKPKADMEPSSSKTTETTTTSTAITKPIKTSCDIRVERKIRTFKIIITLAVVFIACRLPYFCMYIMKLSLKTGEYGKWTWYVNYTFLALHIINCTLNPLLYTFLHPTLKVCTRINKSMKKFVKEICCFCCSSAEFEDFERENPFVVDKFEQQKKEAARNSRVKFEEDCKAVQSRNTDTSATAIDNKY